MKFKYIMTRDIVERLMKESYIRMNTFYLCVYTILYLTISMNLIKYNLGMAFLLYLIGFVILLVFLIIFSKIFMKMHMAKSDKQSSKRYGTFECTIDKDGILEILNGEESMTHWDQVTKVVNARYMILVYTTRSGITVRYRRANFKDKKEYDKVVETIQKHWKKETERIKKEEK